MANSISTNKTYTFIFFQQNCTILWGKNNTKYFKCFQLLFSLILGLLKDDQWYRHWRTIFTELVGKFSRPPLQLMEAGMIGGAALPVLGRGQWSDLRLGIEMGDKWSGPGPHIAQCRLKLSGVSATVFWAKRRKYQSTVIYFRV